MKGLSHKIKSQENWKKLKGTGGEIDNKDEENCYVII